jgi:hypothetical protein
MGNTMDIKALFKAVGGIWLAGLVVSAVYKLTILLPEYWLLVGLGAWAIVIIAAYVGANEFKATKGEQGMIIYTDYFDIFKCLSVIVVPYVIISIGGGVEQIKASRILAGAYAIDRDVCP